MADSAIVTSLKTTRTNLATALESMGDRPNYSIDGQTFTFGELVDRIVKLDEAIRKMETLDAGPVNIETQYVP